MIIDELLLSSKFDKLFARRGQRAQRIRRRSAFAQRQRRVAVRKRQKQVGIHRSHVIIINKILPELDQTKYHIKFFYSKLKNTYINKSQTWS